MLYIQNSKLKTTLSPILNQLTNDISMRKIYSLFLFFFLGFLSKADGQIIIKNGSIDTCGGIFYDDSGETGNYRSNQTYTFTICSNQPGKSHIALGFNMIDIGDGDDLSFFDGNNTSAPLLATSG